MGTQMTIPNQPSPAKYVRNKCQLNLDGSCCISTLIVQMGQTRRPALSVRRKEPNCTVHRPGLAADSKPRRIEGYIWGLLPSYRFDWKSNGNSVCLITSKNLYLMMTMKMYIQFIHVNDIRWLERKSSWKFYRGQKLVNRHVKLLNWLDGRGGGRIGELDELFHILLLPICYSWYYIITTNESGYK